MPERKTAAIVLGIIGLIVVFFTAILPEIRFRLTQTISFKRCTVHFKYSAKTIAPDIDRMAQNKLAFCLCTLYRERRDTAVGNRIVQIYQKYDSYNKRDSDQIHHNIDSILKYKSELLDTLVALD